MLNTKADPLCIDDIMVVSIDAYPLKTLQESELVRNKSVYICRIQNTNGSSNSNSGPIGVGIVLFSRNQIFSPLSSVLLRHLESRHESCHLQRVFKRHNNLFNVVSDEFVD